jgi:hypothetical protein
MQNLDEIQLQQRYTQLYELLLEFPSTKKIDYKLQLKNLLSDLVFKIQKGVNNNSINSKDSIKNYLGKEWEAISRVVDIKDFEIEKGKYKGSFVIFDKWGLGELIIEFNHNTNPTKIKINEP